jgi:2-(1,2-epoxy-1,2-dihydrophenyl)acetyl-CoA isomerase
MTEASLARSYDTVNIWLRDGAATVELARPERLNAWNRQLGVDLLDAVQWVTEEESVRAIVVRGAGRGFSSGADLKDMGPDHDRTPDGRPDVRKRLVELYHPILTGIRRMPKPVVAAVRGPAVGIGCSLALVCDLIVADESAYFMLAFVNIGLVPDGGSSALLPSRVGMTRAIEMALLGERVDAAQALDWGLINRVWPAERFDAEVDALASRLASGPTRSFAGSKRQLNAWIYGEFDRQLDLEADIQQEMAASGDFVEGVMAFVEKRQARFTGA